VERIQRNQSQIYKPFSGNIQKKSQFETRGFAKQSEDSEATDFETPITSRPLQFNINAISRPDARQK
jgi:hypothetical protein